MRFNLCGVLCSNLTIVDDAEQTSGRSREMTKFRQYCAKQIIIGMIKVHPAERNTDLSEVHELINGILKEPGFRIERATYHTDERDGLESAEFEVVPMTEVRPVNLMAEIECPKK